MPPRTATSQPWNSNPTEQNDGAGRHSGKIFGAVAGGLAGLFALTIFFGSWYTIDQTQRAVLLRNGAFVEVVQPGLHFKWPWIESVSKIDMQTHTRVWDKMESYSADQQPAFIKVSVTLHVSPDKVADVYSRFGGDWDAAVGRLISPHVPERTKVVFGQFTAARAISERGKLNTDTAAGLTQAISYDPIFTIDSVQVEDIAFSGGYIKSVEQRMEAEVEVQRLKQNLERERVQADIVRAKANGEADRVRAVASADADAIKLRGNAEAQAIDARAKALAQNTNLVNLIQAERWDGKLPVTMIPGAAVPMLALGNR